MLSTLARGEPAARALQEGLRLLETTDLRGALPGLGKPSLWLAGALRDAAWIEPVVARWRADAALIRSSAEAAMRWMDEVALPTVRATARV